jgi:hypothetical protein
MKRVMATVILLLFFLLAFSSTAAGNCNLITQQDINNGAFVITQPGDYCLAEDIHVDYNWKNQHGVKVIDVRTRDVNINLRSYSLINDDESARMRGNYNTELQAIAARGAPLTGTELVVKNGKIVGFDFGVKDIALRRTSKFVVKNVIFKDVYTSIWARPVNAWIKNNYFVNNQQIINSVVGVSLQQTDKAVVSNNVFLNHHTTIEVAFGKTASINKNYIRSSDVNLPVLPRGILILDVKDANIAKNKLNSLYWGIQTMQQSGVSVVRNSGCGLVNPLFILPPSGVGQVGNNWNYC